MLVSLEKVVELRLSVFVQAFFDRVVDFVLDLVPDRFFLFTFKTKDQRESELQQDRCDLARGGRKEAGASLREDLGRVQGDVQD